MGRRVPWQCHDNCPHHIGHPTRSNKPHLLPFSQSLSLSLHIFHFRTILQRGMPDEQPEPRSPRQGGRPGLPPNDIPIAGLPPPATAPSTNPNLAMPLPPGGFPGVFIGEPMPPRPQRSLSSMLFLTMFFFFMSQNGQNTTPLGTIGPDGEIRERVTELSLLRQHVKEYEGFINGTGNWTEVSARKQCVACPFVVSSHEPGLCDAGTIATPLSSIYSHLPSCSSPSNVLTAATCPAHPSVEPHSHALRAQRRRRAWRALLPQHHGMVPARDGAPRRSD